MFKVGDRVWFRDNFNKVEGFGEITYIDTQGIIVNSDKNGDIGIIPNREHDDLIYYEEVYNSPLFQALLENE